MSTSKRSLLYRFMPHSDIASIHSLKGRQLPPRFWPSSQGVSSELRGNFSKKRLKAHLEDSRDLCSLGTVGKSLHQWISQPPPAMALEQIIAFLRGKSFPEGSKIETYLLSLQTKYPAIEDFWAMALQTAKGPMSIKVYRGYAHALIKEKKGEESLIAMAQHEGLPCIMRIASALELSFAKNKKGVAFLVYFMNRQDFRKHQNYILKKVRDSKLKEALLKIRRPNQCVILN